MCVYAIHPPHPVLILICWLFLLWLCRLCFKDAHTAEVSVDGMPENSFFAVYDGHGGKTVSTIA